MRDHAAAPADLPRGTLADLFLERVDRGGSRPLYQHFEGDSNELVSLGIDETVALVGSLMDGMRRVGLEAGDRAAILSENRTEWALVDWACILSGVVSVPVYDTLPADPIAFILADAGVKLVFTSTREQAGKAIEALDRADLPGVPVVRFDEDGDDEEGVIPWARFVDRGAGEKTTLDTMRANAASISPDDLATLIYTSGTTGTPKGVMLSHGNLHSNVVATGSVLEVTSSDVSMSFLPLSHVFQRMTDFLLFRRGCIIARAHEIHSVAEDLRAVRPTIEVSVPRLYEKVYSRVTAQRGLRGALVRWAIGVGARWTDATLGSGGPSHLLSLQHDLADRLVFSKVRAAVGGRLRFFVSGGAPLAPDLARFFFAAGLPILEGYGLTETSPVTNVNPLDAIRIGTVGPPVPGTEIRIAPDGEILVRGPQVMQGYFGRPDATAEVIDADGWLSTGDIGELDDDGYLRVTDRKKDILVTAGGKNVAPQPIESRLKTHPLIDQVVMIGDRRKFCSLLIVPDFGAVEQWASGNGVTASGRRGLVHDSDVQREFATILDALGDLASYEQPKKIGLLTREFTIEDGTLTPTQKIKRRVVQERYAEEIDCLYDAVNRDRDVIPIGEPEA
ncbi:MAG: long-chain fatty acid--CoA ligase [Longimicrobiales bacterium]|nr:long-chain fatty acid--CoA ligase [Longimicrobiales bacterium]